MTWTILFTAHEGELKDLCDHQRNVQTGFVNRCTMYIGTAVCSEHFSGEEMDLRWSKKFPFIPPLRQLSAELAELWILNNKVVGY